jgi:hypothetical protein
MSSERTREAKYQLLLDIREREGLARFGPMTNQVWRDRDEAVSLAPCPRPSRCRRRNGLGTPGSATSHRRAARLTLAGTIAANS